LFNIPDGSQRLAAARQASSAQEPAQPGPCAIRLVVDRVDVDLVCFQTVGKAADELAYRCRTNGVDRLFTSGISFALLSNGGGGVEGLAADIATAARAPLTDKRLASGRISSPSFATSSHFLLSLTVHNMAFQPCKMNYCKADHDIVTGILCYVTGGRNWP
jgi:hypothetical protein